MSFVKTLRDNPVFETLKSKFEQIFQVLDEIRTRPRYTTIEIIHDDDADGWAAATMLQNSLLVFGIGAHIKKTAVLHGQPFQDFVQQGKVDERTDLVFILDHCLEPWLATWLSRHKHARSHILIDHHVTDQVTTGKNIAVISTEFSTTALTYMFSLWLDMEEDVGMINPDAVKAVDYNDRWLYGEEPSFDNTARWLMTKFDSEGYRDVNWNYVIGSDDVAFEGYVREGQSLYNAKQKEIARIVDENVFVMSNRFDGVLHTYGVVFHSGRPSELGAAIMEKYRDLISFAMIISSKDNGNLYKVSLRSGKNFADVQKIAKALGGGGHRNAAGATVSYLTMTNLINPYEDCNFRRALRHV